MNALLQCTLGVVLILCVMTPVTQSQNTCSVQYQYWGTEAYTVYQRQRYTVSCGWCGTQRCSRYRQAPNRAYRLRLFTSYRRECCSGWRKDRYGRCLMAICNPSCYSTRGRCVRPNQCQCNPGFTGRTCSNDINECQVGSGAPSCDHICINTIGSYRCECRSGFRLDTDQHSCTDIDECSMMRTHNCHHICVNTIGSYSCDCYPGYEISEDGKQCMDLDDCAEENDCEQICINKPGRFACKCWPGYEPNQGGNTCSDINECQTDTLHDCEHICLNDVGNYTCSCNDGFELGMEGKQCFDIDECAPPSMNCEMVEVCNTFNSSCTYVKGFKIDTEDCFSDTSVLSDIDLDACARQEYNCSDLQVCQQKSADNVLCACITTSGNALSDVMTPTIRESATSIYSSSIQSRDLPKLTGCLNISGSLECEDFPLNDYELRIDDQFCQDNRTNDCNSMQTCRNTEGSFECPCMAGYTMDNVTGDCYDIDECSTDFMNCPKLLPVQICAGPDDNITCQCVEGEVKVCTGGDGCVKNCKGLQVCLDNTCTCHSDHFLNSENKPCEGGGCGEMIHDCTEMEYCRNTVGGYKCDCIQGYERNKQTGLCEDVNECLEKTSQCYHLCMNLEGNYSCACVEGYTLGEDGYSCSMPMGLFEAYVALKDDGGLNDAYDVVLDSGSEWYLFPLGILVGIACWIFIAIGRKKSERFKKATDIPVHAVQNLQGRVVESATQVRGRYSVRGGGNQSNVYMARPTQARASAGARPSDAGEEPGEDATIYSPSVIVAEVRRTSKYQTRTVMSDETDLYQVPSANQGTMGTIAESTGVEDEADEEGLYLDMHEIQ